MREYLPGRPARFTATIVSKIRRRITHRLAAAISQCGQGMPQQFALWIGIASHETPYACRNEKTLGTATCHPEDVESSARRTTPDEGSMYIVHALQQSGSRCKDRSAGTTLQLPASKHACGSHHPAQSLAKPTRELQVQKPLHLPCERRPISVPPNFLYPRQTIRIQILDPHHLLKPESPMRSPNAARLHPAMWRFTDPKT